jgi:general secretion pathway protein G
VSRKPYVFIALVLLLLLLCWPRGFDSQKQIELRSRIHATRDQIQIYESALKRYETDNGNFPTTEQGLQALVALPTRAPVPQNWNGPYVKPPIVRKDFWNHDFIYFNPGHHNTTTYDLFSHGPDGIQGNRDDIRNWQ